MKLLVGIDGKGGGDDAAELARVLCKRAEDPRVTLVTVLSSGSLPMEYALLSDEEASEFDDIFDHARRRLPEISVETRVYGGGSPPASSPGSPSGRSSTPSSSALPTAACSAGC